MDCEDAFVLARSRRLSRVLGVCRRTHRDRRTSKHIEPAVDRIAQSLRYRHGTDQAPGIVVGLFKGLDVASAHTCPIFIERNNEAIRHTQSSAEQRSECARLAAAGLNDRILELTNHPTRTGHDHPEAGRETAAQEHLRALGADELDARPWRPAPAPPSAVDLTHYALWRSTELAPDAIASALTLLHAARILGFADTPVIGQRFSIGPVETERMLLDAQAFGWLQYSAFAGLQGWSLTESGRAQNERQLREELARTGKAGQVHSAHRDFLPLNARLQRACTEWQLFPTADNKIAENDHSDLARDGRILDELTSIGSALVPLASRLSAVLARFDGYSTRFETALRRARGGEACWVDGTGVDSCHRVWFELHEDFIATLGIDRQSC